MLPQNAAASELPWTGERLVATNEGNIVVEHMHRYALAVELAAGKRVLDIASGEGYGSNLLAEVAQSVIGVDISAEVVEHASRKYQRPNLKFLIGSCDAIPVETASIDLLVSFETIEHHAQHQEMMAEVKRVLAPGGVLIISTPDRHVYSDVPKYANPFHVKELYREEFEKLLLASFSHVTLLGQLVVEGSLMVPVNAQPINTPFVIFQGDLTKIRREAGLQLPRYLLALASDGAPLHVVSASLMGRLSEQTNFVEQRLQWLQDQLAERDRTLAERDRSLAERDRSLAECRIACTALEQRLSSIFNSWSWRLSRPLRLVGGGLQRLKKPNR